MKSADPSPSTIPKKRMAYLPLAIVLLLAILERLAMWWLYQPVSYSDTNSYRRLASQILAGWVTYDGTRVPVYPLFLALLGPDERVWINQMILGIAIALLGYFVAYQLSRNAWFAGLAILVHLANLGQLFFEANLLTETLTTFWIMLALAGVIYGMAQPRARSVWLAVGLGLASALALLTRPIFIYLPFWLLLFVIYTWHEQPVLTQPGRPFLTWFSKYLKANLGPVRRSWVYLLAFLLPFTLVTGSWVGFIRTHYNQWGLSTMTGYHLIQHTGVFFEYVPDQYAGLRDTYLRYRDAHIARYGTQTNTIWEAIPEMQKISGLNFYDLSRVLARISVQLIREHPGLYLRGVLEGWWMFWLAPVYWAPEAFRWSGLVPVLRAIIRLERLALVASNGLFVLTSILAVIWPKVRRAWQMDAAWWCLLGTVWIASFVQTLLDHGDNPRFLVPLQSLVVLWVLWLGWRILAPRLPALGLKSLWRTGKHP